jgi:hypothetical protein
MDDGRGWDKAARVAAGRVVEGRPGWDGGGVWRGTVEDAAGARYAGELRGLRPCGEGVLTEGGARFRVAHADGAATLAEGDAPGRMPAPARKEVRARALPPDRILQLRFATESGWTKPLQPLTVAPGPAVAAEKVCNRWRLVLPIPGGWYCRIRQYQPPPLARRLQRRDELPDPAPFPTAGRRGWCAAASG